MANRTIAARYARALLDVSIAADDPQRVEKDLESFVDLVAGHDGLRKVLQNPVVAAAKKQAIMRELASKSGASTPVQRLLDVLAERDRLAILDEILAAYRDRLMDHLRIVRAEVVTAVPVPPDSVAALERSLSESTGKQVSLQTRVDPTIIGGVVSRIGGTVFDGSVRTQLQRMKEKLAQAG
jgi:F-type H+-transporting ATPase subunit delta